ncbi:MAG: response regulator [Bacteroidaceae bacterium]|nr:response regulator [Bacteroidaceae bacterium]
MMKRLFTLFGICFTFWVMAVAQTGHFIPADRFSNSIVSDLCQDKYGNIWVATDYGLNRYDGYNFTTYLHDDADPASLCNNAVVSLLCDRDGRLWVGTNRGLDRYSPADGTFIHYPFPEGYLPRVCDLVQLADGTVLVCTPGYGLFVVGDDETLHLTKDYSFSPDDFFFVGMFEDSKRRVWKHDGGSEFVMKDDYRFYKLESTLGGVVGFVERADEVLVVCSQGFMAYHGGELTIADIDMSVLGNNDVTFSVVSTDAEGNIYIGTRNRGLYKVAIGSRNLERVEVNASGCDLSSSNVRILYFDRKDNLWLGLERKGLLMVTQTPMQFSTWSLTAQNVLLGSTISSVCEGDDGVTWCAMQGVGVYGFDANGRLALRSPNAPTSVEYIYRDKQRRYWLGTDNCLYSFDPLKGKYNHVATLNCARINCMVGDSEGNLYISAWGAGFSVYSPSANTLNNYNMYMKDEELGQLCNDWLLCMIMDHQGLLWMGTSSGVSCFNPTTGSFLSQGWEQQLDGVMCFSICELKDGNIAVGTDKGLYLYDRKEKSFAPFPNSNVMGNKIVTYIAQSNDGDLWCSTSMGIWRYDMLQERFVGYISGNGLEKKEYTIGVGMHTDVDRICFGHNDGLTVFYPREVRDHKPDSGELMLTSLLVGGVPVNASTELNGVRITHHAVPETKELNLSHRDHTLTMSFSQFDFINPYNVVFEYRINDGDWVKNPEGKNDFTLSLMRSGLYRIEVRALQGDVYSPLKVIKVIVRAPWYRTPFAMVIYVLLSLVICAVAIQMYRRRMAEHLNEEKMKFLINCTHDIRSPLTLIMSPLANLKRRIDVNQVDVRRDIDTIEHNATRILSLVNQILDVRKIDKQQMQLQCRKTDMVRFLYGLYKMYEYNAAERGIKFNFVHDGIEKLDVWFDRSQFDKVISNLLSNAFKYSYDGGTVEIRLTHDDDMVRIEVADTGVGLDKDTVKHIFDRFYQGANSRKMHINGTGIGLNLCKMIIDMHQGTIEAFNRTDVQRGSLFVVTLPLGTEHIAEENMEKEDLNTSNMARNSSRAQHTVLIVDDDLEIAHYITTELGQYYKFGICANGKEGVKELLTNEYDVVVSDVMMPEMDGFTMLRMIKTNMHISHIPVIMLTSKADIGNRLEGLERGADAFLAKPFNMEELHMNIENLIHNRQRLKGKFSGAQQQADKVEQCEVKGNDELLMERIMKAVNKNISDSNFNVDMLTHEVGISRAQLHRKMKEMTGISTSEFIRNIRLEQAARLLREQKVNVTQVAYTVGFSNLAHFSTIFRKHFGVSPTEYMERES